MDIAFNVITILFVTIVVLPFVIMLHDLIK